MTERSDGALAPVTYLPGVQAPSERPSTAAASARPAPVPARLALDDEPASGADATRAHDVSLRALTRRGMSRREVERTLRSRELDEETVAGELDRLEASGLIDDLALAQNLVGILQERKGYGRQAIAAELTRRLLSPAAIAYALELIDTSDELSRAREVALKRAAQLRSYDRETAVRRLSGYLMRRGYSGSTLRAAVEHALPSTPQGRVRFR
jgi:regulatory protein